MIFHVLFFFFKNTKKNVSKNSVHVGKLPVIPFFLSKKEVKVLICEVFLLHFRLKSQWLLQWEEDPFLS